MSAAVLVLRRDITLPPTVVKAKPGTPREPSGPSAPIVVDIAPQSATNGTATQHLIEQRAASPSASAAN